MTRPAGLRNLPGNGVALLKGQHTVHGPTGSAPHRERAPAAGKTLMRRDIQGLRALAVGVVILDHLLHWPSGGFVGVDMFFVISGFLITGHLVREWERTGTIGFLLFYKRRIKRIMPASLLVLIVTVGTAAALFTPTRAQGILVDGLWSALMSANWRFASAGTDYFQLDGPVSPLQHFWSLAVEEQFYLVWPVLLLIAMALTMRGTRAMPARLAAALPIILVSAVSFAWALAQTMQNPTGAYFSTLTRVWELGIGAGLALAAPLLLRIPDALRPVAAWAGLVGIVLSVSIVGSDSGFPAPWAALPVASTALVIAAGTGGEQRLLWPLNNRVAGYLGDASYSLYLWHFPVIVFGKALLPADGPVQNLLLVAVMFFLSLAAYHLVEDPIRRSPWLTGTRQAWMRYTAPAAFRPVALVTLAVLAMTFWAAPVVQRAASEPALAAAGPGSTGAMAAGTSAADLPPALAKWQGAVESAANAGKWPRLDPSIDDMDTQKWVEEIRSLGCADTDPANLSACRFGDSEGPLAVVVGDSFAMAWGPGLRKSLEAKGYTVQFLTRGQCPAADVSVTRDGGKPYTDCDKHQDWAYKTTQKLKPDLVILASARNTLDRLATAPQEASVARDEYAAGVRSAVDKVSAKGRDVVVLASPPEGAKLQECYTALSAPSSCLVAMAPEWSEYFEAESKAARAGGAREIDTHLFLCTADGMCPGFVGTSPARVDDGHLSVAFSRNLAPVLSEALFSHDTP